MNIAANTAAYDAWVKSHTPLQIKEANTARLSLSRLVDKNYPPIKDDRLPKLPRSAYLLYLGDRSDTVDYQGKSGQQTFTAIAHEWNELPQSEKEVRTPRRIDTYRIAHANYSSSATTNCKSKIANGTTESTRRCTESQHPPRAGNHPKPRFQPEPKIRN